MILYKSGYKYQLYADHIVELPTIEGNEGKIGDYVTLSKTGCLTILHGYAWDGPSGPAIDTRNFMRGSLVHDALYQLLRNDQLPGHFRGHADRILRDICREDGMSRLRSWWVYRTVRLFGGRANRHKKELLSAP